MVTWWHSFHSSLWILGLALILAVLSVAEYQASSERVGLAEPGRQVLLLTGVSLFCLGLLLGAGTWWERAIWGLLALLTAWQTLRLGRRLRHGALAVSEADAAAESRVAPAVSKRYRWLGWGLVLAGLLVMGGWAAVTGIRAMSRARSLQSRLTYLERTIEPGASQLKRAELELVGQHLTGMREDLQALRARIGPLLPAGRLLGWVPRYGGDLAAAADLLEMATRLGVAGDGTYQALLPALQETVGEWDDPERAQSVGERILPLLVAARPALTAARQELTAGQAIRKRIDAQELSPRVAGYLQRLDRTLPWFETAADGALLAPGLLGGSGPRTYLILAQNNDELRPTGGFISGVGELRVEEGRLVSLRFADSYAVEDPSVPRPTTPQDLQQTLFGELWYFRDANWDADFPTSARRALEFYAADQGVVADGVIALDLVALRWLVEALGPLEVPGIKDAISGDNVLEIVRARWTEPQPGMSQEQSTDWWLHRKDSMGQIAGAAMERLMAGQDVPLAELTGAVKQALDERHILLYLRDPDAAALLRKRGWSGDLPDALSTEDSLLVVDTNVGFNKVDANVARSIGYLVDLSDADRPRARLTLTYENRGTKPIETCIQEAKYDGTYADMMDGCYWDYVRVFVPPGSQLLEGPGIPLPGGSLHSQSGDAASQRPIAPVLNDKGRITWAAFFDLAPGAERTLVFDYQLPASVLRSAGEDGLVRYGLWVRKQPGTEAVPLEVQILLPAGAELVDARPGDRPWQQDAAPAFTPSVTPAVAPAVAPGVAPSVVTDLRTDRVFELLFRAEERP